MGLVWHLRRTDGTDDATVTATDDGAQWTVTLTAATSAGLTAGEYRWALRATASGVVQTLASGTCTVTPDLTAIDEDVRTWEEQTLAVVKAALKGTIEGETRMYMIAGRQVQTFSPDELMRLKDRLEAVVQAQRTGTFGVALRFDVVGLR